MPRPRGPHGRDESTVLAVRTPIDLAAEVYAAAGLEMAYTETGKVAPGGAPLAEHIRNVLRASVRRKLTYEVGYEEGKMQGWADAQARLRSAMKGV